MTLKTKNVIADCEIQKIKPRPKKYKLTILWRRFTIDQHMDVFTKSVNEFPMTAKLLAT